MANNGGDYNREAGAGPRGDGDFDDAHNGQMRNQQGPPPVPPFVPAGWNDPPDVSAQQGRAAPRRRLHQRVGFDVNERYEQFAMPPQEGPSRAAFYGGPDGMQMNPQVNPQNPPPRNPQNPPPRNPQIPPQMNPDIPPPPPFPLPRIPPQMNPHGAQMNHQIPQLHVNPQVRPPAMNPQVPRPPMNRQVPPPPMNHQVPPPPMNPQVPPPPMNAQMRPVMNVQARPPMNVQMRPPMNALVRPPLNALVRPPMNVQVRFPINTQPRPPMMAQNRPPMNPPARHPMGPRDIPPIPMPRMRPIAYVPPPVQIPPLALGDELEDLGALDIQPPPPPPFQASPDDFDRNGVIAALMNEDEERERQQRSSRRRRSGPFGAGGLSPGGSVASAGSSNAPTGSGRISPASGTSSLRSSELSALSSAGGTPNASRLNTPSSGTDTPRERGNIPGLTNVIQSATYAAAAATPSKHTGPVSYAAAAARFSGRAAKATYSAPSSSRQTSSAPSTSRQVSSAGYIAPLPSGSGFSSLKKIVVSVTPQPAAPRPAAPPAVGPGDTRPTVRMAYITPCNQQTVHHEAILKECPSCLVSGATAAAGGRAAAAAVAGPSGGGAAAAAAGPSGSGFAAAAAGTSSSGAASAAAGPSETGSAAAPSGGQQQPQPGVSTGAIPRQRTVQFRHGSDTRSPGLLNQRREPIRLVGLAYSTDDVLLEVIDNLTVALRGLTSTQEHLIHMQMITDNWTSGYCGSEIRDLMLHISRYIRYGQLTEALDLNQCMTAFPEAHWYVLFVRNAVGILRDNAAAAIARAAKDRARQA